MIGHIESYDPDSQTGVIKSEEKSYTFHFDDWVAQVPQIWVMMSTLT